MTEIKEIKVVPSRDIIDAKFVRYRDEDGRIKEYGVIEVEKGRFLLSSKRLSQLFRYLDAKISEMRKIREWRERDDAFFSALENCSKELVFSVIGNEVIRIVSSDFTAIPHSKVLQIVEQELKLSYEDRKVEFDGGMFAKWTLRSLPKECVRLGEIVSWNLWCYNYNIGNKALRIGGGFTVLACQNGATAWKSATKVRLVHRGSYEDLINRIMEAVDTIINHDLPVIAYQIQEAQQVKYARELAEQLIQQYPQWIQEKIRKELQKAKTLWDLSNAFSWVATHEPVTFNQRMSLSNRAIEVLQLAERR